MSGVSVDTFTDRRRAQLAGELDEQLFTPAYRSPPPPPARTLLASVSDPDRPPPAYRSALPSPDGTLLAWVSDRDGRPRAYVGPMPAGEKPAELPAAPLDTEVDPAVACDVKALSWCPDGSFVACEVAPGGGERT